jgi:transposase-like protein
MTGEEIFGLLNKMAARGDTPRKREKHLRKLAEKLGLSSDALRAKARRHARKAGVTYPLMRKPASQSREKEREDRRVTRRSWREERIQLGAEALARGADWAEIATLFGIKTPEGAAQWWRRNHDGVKSGRKTRRRRRARATTPRG